MSRFTPILVPLCASVQAVISLAAECPNVISSSCEITELVTGKGPLYTIPDSTSAIVTLQSSINALNRGEAFLFQGKSPDTVLNLKMGSATLADYTPIVLQSESSSGAITVNGFVSSQYESAFKAGYGASYDLQVGGSVVSLSEYFHTIHLDGTASGSLNIEGALTGASGGILYSTDADKLGLSTVGSHSLTIGPNASLTAMSNTPIVSNGVITIGDPANINMVADLPVYHLETLVVGGAVRGNGTGIALLHGRLQTGEWVINEEGSVYGEQAAIQLGKISDGKSYASYDGEIVNNGLIVSDGKAIAAEGDIKASVINNGTIESAMEEVPVAVDFSLSTQALSFTQNAGVTRGAIYGGMQEMATVTFNGGSYNGDLFNAGTIVLGKQLKLSYQSPPQGELSGAWVHLSAPEIVSHSTQDLAIAVSAGTYKGTISYAGSLRVDTEAALQLTAPTALDSAVINGLIGLDMDAGNTKLAYVVAEDSLTFGEESAVQLHITKAELGFPYPIFSSAQIDNEPATLTTSNVLLTVTGDKPAETTYTATFQIASEKSIDENLKRAGVSSNQRAAANAYIEGKSPALEATREMLIDAGDNPAQLAKLAQELTPASQTTTQNLQATTQRVASRVQARIVQTGVSSGDHEHNPVSGFWAQVHKDKSDQEKNSDQLGYKGEQTGLTLGYDREDIVPGTLGVAFSALDNETKYKGSPDKINTDVYLFTLYGSTPTVAGEVSGQISYGWVDNDIARYVNGTKHKTSHDSYLLNLQVLLENAELLRAWVPLAVVGGVNVTYVYNDSYRFGGPYLHENIRSEDSTAFELGLGLRYASSPIADNLTPRASVTGWYDLSNDKLNTRYSVGTSPTITVRAPSKKRFTATGELGLDYLKDALTYSAELTGIWRSGFSDIGLLGRIRYEF